MTTDTGANHMTMINCAAGHGCPGCGSRLMAGVAGIAGIDMATTLTTGGCAVMTTEAGANHLIMINGVTGDRCPVGREHRMAGIAIIACVYMAGIFTAGRNAIVTTYTVTDETGMVYGGDSCPVGSDMAGITFQCCLKMSGTFALRDYIVVATTADSDDLVMVHRIVCNG